MEKLFTIELNLKVMTNRRDGGPDEGEVMEAFSTRLHGRKVPSVTNTDHPLLQGEGWACVAINGQVKGE